MLLITPALNTPRSNKKGFTLIELLVVIAIIMILSGITFGIARGVSNVQARTRAQADLAVISQAIEQFEGIYGSYPTTDNPANTEDRIDQSNQRLVHSIRGNMDWVRDGKGKATALKARWDIKDYEGAPQGKNLLEEKSLNASVIVDGIEQFQDPWGRPYIYDYSRFNGAWENFGYILCSAGPDGLYESVGNDGILTPEIRNHQSNIDNIYVSE